MMEAGRVFSRHECSNVTKTVIAVSSELEAALGSE
jgi:hypothetical protein